MAAAALNAMFAKRAAGEDGGNIAPSWAKALEKKSSPSKKQGAAAIKKGPIESSADTSENLEKVLQQQKEGMLTVVIFTQ
jgi:hypothetical protein